MKVFISWSGNRSRAVGELLNDWIKCVLQAARPWMSTHGIDRGAVWYNEINEQLKDTAVGVVCLTHENKSRPWILFEAGALAKGLSSSHVCTFLIDLQNTDLEGPLAQFNHTLPDRAGVRKLVGTLNRCLGTGALDDRILEQVFTTYWPQFQKRFEEVLKENPPNQKPEPRSGENILAEILENTRSLQHQLRRNEANGEQKPLIDSGSYENSFAAKSEAFIRQELIAGTPIPEIAKRAEVMGMTQMYAMKVISRITHPEQPTPFPFPNGYGQEA
jgi:hypothetical protein